MSPLPQRFGVCRSIAAWTGALVIGVAAFMPLRAHAGDPRWPQSGYDAGHTWFNASERQLNRTNVGTLAESWTNMLGQFYIGPSAQAHGRIVVCSNLFGISVVNADNGKRIANQENLIGDNCGSPAIQGTHVYVTTSSANPNFGYLSSLDSSGNVRWTSQSTGDTSLGFQNPVVDAGTVFVSDRRDAVYAFDGRTGATLWRSHTGDMNNEVTVGAGVALVSTWGSTTALRRLFAFDTNTGARVWAAATDTSNMQYPAVVSNGLAVTGSDSGVVRAFDLASGHKAWEHAVSGYVSAPLAAAGPLVYVVHGNQTISALAVQTGELVWTVSMGDCAVASNLAVANGVIFFTTVGIAGHRLDTLDAANGAVIGASRAGSLSGSYGKVTVVDGQVQIGTNQGVLHVYALPPASRQ